MIRARYVELAGVRLAYAPRYPDTFLYFGAYDRGECDSLPENSAPISIPEDFWQRNLRGGMEPCAHSEYSLLTHFMSDELLLHDRVVIHGAALRWKNLAWLICAESGVGKSTQARFLRELRPGEFEIISGDRPILQFCRSERETAQSKAPSSHVPDETILVHPSPWNGKENWFGGKTAPLAGVIYLQRGPENRLYVPQSTEIAIPMYMKLLQSSADPERVKQAARMTTRLLEQSLLWQLQTHTVPDSTRLLLEAVFPADSAAGTESR